MIFLLISVAIIRVSIGEKKNCFSLIALKCAGGDSCCSSGSKCDVGEGDCDRDADCKSGRCEENSCDRKTYPSFDSTDDCCQPGRCKLSYILGRK